MSRNISQGRISMLPELFSFDPDVKGESRNNKNLHLIIRRVFLYIKHFSEMRTLLPLA